MEELKQNYGYIKMAFTRLEEKYELDKAEWELQIEELKLSGGEAVNSEEVKRQTVEKNKQIDELKERLEEFADSERYIESLTDQILNKDSAINTLNIEIKELKA